MFDFIAWVVVSQGKIHWVVHLGIYPLLFIYYTSQKYVLKKKDTLEIHQPKAMYGSCLDLLHTSQLLKRIYETVGVIWT